MIGRLFSGTLALLLYFCLATLLAQAIVVGYLVSQWNLDGSKVARMIALARGLEPPSAAATPPPKQESPQPQASYDEILEARAVKDKNLRLRELAIDNALVELSTDRRKLDEENKHLAAIQAEFNKQLDATLKDATSTGREEVARILQTVKPRQAKEFLVQMLDKQEIEDVVMLLSGMSDTKRAKILGEFKTPEETLKIEEVLRRIRQGAPQAPVADEAKQQLEKPK